MIHFRCPTCRNALTAPPEQSGLKIPCPHCGQRLQIPPSSGGVAPVEGQIPLPAQPPVAVQFDFQHHDPAVEAALDPHSRSIRTGQSTNHSGLGIASFIIALLVGGLDVVLFIVVSINIARSGNSVSAEYKMLSGTIAIYFLNCMSLPLCIVGAGLGGVALVVHKDHNHLFSWIGLLGNGMLIFGVVGIYLVASLATP